MKRKTKNTQLIPLHQIENEVLAEQVEEYLEGRTGFPVPTLSEFCIRYGYEYERYRECMSRQHCILQRIYLQAIVTLEKFLVIDVSKMEFTNDGKTFKIDKKGIIEQLKQLREELKE